VSGNEELIEFKSENWLSWIMKASLVAAALCIFLSHPAQAATSLYDDFNGAQIDTSIWQVQLPFSNSSVTESGGNAIFQSRGQLITTSQFSGSPTGLLDIQGSFAFTGGSDETFRVVPGTDGAVINVYGELGGPVVVLNGPAISGGNVGIEDQTSSGGVNGIYANFSFALNTYFSFRITDDGNNIAVYISDFGNSLLSESDTYSLGNHVGLYDRETYGGYNQNPGVSLDYISITVPEPSTFALLGFGVAALTVARRRT
jgi:hypothetical protein